MKVAIWGSYNHGNYGDDLMAILFAKHLNSIGVKPCVYRLDKKLASLYSINSTYSLEEMLDGARFCIIGGGGMLVGENKNIQKNVINLKNDFENDFRELYVAISDMKCPIFPISVGGDGRGENTFLPFWRNKFWQSPLCNLSTVRLKSDCSLLKSLDKEVVHYPDILFRLTDFWKLDPPNKSSNKLNIGININNSWKTRLFAFYISQIARQRKDIVFHFIKTQLPGYSTQNELLPPINSQYIKHHIYEEPLSTLKFLQSLDLVISHKLHLGLTALTLNVPFYSFNGKGKTRSFLKSINAEFAIFSSNDVIKLLDLITNTDKIKETKSKFDFAIIQEHKELSKGHLNFLTKIVNDCSEKASYL